MKINDTELEIIKNYVIKSKQERIIWEFENSEKRKHMMMTRFSGPDILKSSCLQPVNYMFPDEMEKSLFRLNGVREVYFMGESFIGNLSLKEAVKRANDGEICIIYCGNGVGYYQGGECGGSPPRYLLIQKS